MYFKVWESTRLLEMSDLDNISVKEIPQVQYPDLGCWWVVLY